jgi:hypothetical protein
MRFFWQRSRRPSRRQEHRSYRRERDQYYRDEARDFERGADYIPEDERPRGRFEYRDYSPRNMWEREYRGQAPFSSQEYAPSRDYGFERDEYYVMDPSHRGHPDSEMTGYGNYGSSQGRDFENWLHGPDRYRDHRHRNFNPGDFANHHFPGEHERRGDERRFDTGAFGAGLYDYRQEQHFGQGKYGRNRFGRNKHFHDHKLHDRSDRHMEIVRPFKDPDDYGRNDYNSSWGYGRNEMSYHDDRD